MALDNKNTIIGNHLGKLKKKGSAKKSILSLLGGAVLIAVVGFMSFGNPSGNSIATPDLPMERWEVEEKPKSVLVSNKTISEGTEIVAIINPTKEQMERLKLKKAGRKVIRENKKRTQKTKVSQIGLTSKEVTMLEDANIVGSNNNIFKESDLKRVNNNSKIGISDETYSAEEVKNLHTVTTGYRQKENK